MKCSRTSLGTSTDKIVARFRKVRRAAKKAAKSGRRFADYRYLRSVLSAYRYFEANGQLSHVTEIAPSILITPVRTNRHPLRLIIDATCNNFDLQKRSRWTRALEYAVAENIDPKDLARFFRANNGIAGCAELASKTKVRRPR